MRPRQLQIDLFLKNLSLYTEPDYISYYLFDKFLIDEHGLNQYDPSIDQLVTAGVFPKDFYKYKEKNIKLNEGDFDGVAYLEVISFYDPIHHFYPKYDIRILTVNKIKNLKGSFHLSLYREPHIPNETTCFFPIKGVKKGDGDYTTFLFNGLFLKGNFKAVEEYILGYRDLLKRRDSNINFNVTTLLYDKRFYATSTGY